MNLDSLMIAVTNIGSPQSVVVVCVLLGVFLLLHKKPHHFFQFIIFMSLGGLSVWFLKQYFHIARPVGGIIEASGYSFPSGHATMSTLFCCIVAYAYVTHIRHKLEKVFFVIVCLSIAGLISYSRIYLGVHTLQDIVGGIAIGVFWFVCSVLFYTYISRPKKV